MLPLHETQKETIVMKVLYVLSNSNLDGSTLSFLTLLNGVLAQNHHAVVIIPSENAAFSEKLTSIDVKTYVVPYEFYSWPKQYGIKRLLGYPFVLARMLVLQKRNRRVLTKIIRLEKPDIVHTNVSPLDVGHYAAKKCNIPHVWHIREYCDKDFNIKLFPSKTLYRKKLNSDWTISITKDLQAYNSLGNCERSTVIYNGVRSIKDTKYNQHKSKYFLCASRISEEKGFDRTIHVFASFVKKHPDYELVILGEGYDYYIDHLKALITDLDIENNVCFKGFTNDVDSYMECATALLVASPSEGFGRMTAEAAFAGCLVIGYNSAGTREILETTGGFLWDDDADYLNAMENVASMSKENYSSKALFAQSKAKMMYSQESYISQIMSFYSKIVNC